MLNLIDLIIGALLLLVGRRLFWLVVGGAGFLLGMQLASQFLADQPQWIMLLAAFAAGLVGALLAIFFQRAAFALAGAVAGAALASHLANTWSYQDYHTAVILVGGVLGLVLAIAFTDWAIIILSALVGAGAIVSALDLPPNTGSLVMLVLLVVGIFVQRKQLKGAA